MNRKHLILSAILLSASVLFVGCQKEEEPGKQNGGNNTEDKEDIQIGEQITVNITTDCEWDVTDVLGLQIPSVEISNQSASYTEGKFSIEIPTPASGAVIYAYSPFNPTAADGNFTVTLPSEISGNDGSVKAKVASPISLGEITDPMDVVLSMSDVMGTIRLKLTDATSSGALNGQAITSVIITTETYIAGDVAVSITNGQATLSEGSKNVTITPSEGTALGTEAVILDFSAVPGTYAGSITVNTEASTCEIPLNTTISAGQIMEIEAGCTKEEYKGIENAEDWNAFIAGIIAGDYTRFVNPETNAVELASSFTCETELNFPSTEENSSVEFNGTLDGKGFEITFNNFKHPLLNYLGSDAVVKNITVRGSYTQMQSPALCGNAVIAKVNKGTIENVNSYVNSELTIENGVIFGAICGQNGGTLKNCKNYGNMTLTYAATGASGFYGGGLCAIGHTTSGEPSATFINVDETCSPGQFINCENHGTISLTAKNGKPVRQGFGGICGLVYMNGVKFENCKNTGNISRISDGETSNNFSASVGGILGRSAAWYTTGNGDSGALDNGYDGSGKTLGDKTGNGYDTEITGCSNSGNIYCKCRHSGGVIAGEHTRRSDNIGGIVGLSIGADGHTLTITNCSNTGKLEAGWASTVNTASLGGITGYACFTTISNCSAINEIKSIDNQPIGAAGGIVGYAMSDVEIKDNCISVPTMDVYGKPNSTNFLYGLLIGNIHTSATVTSASVAGSIKADGTDKAITSSNYTDYLVSSASNKVLSSPGTTWYTAQ